MLPRNPRKLISRRLFLDLDNRSFQKVLHCLLNEWEFQVLERPESGGVVLVQEGRPVPEEAGPVILLVSSRYLVPGRISIPVSLEELWSHLENRFHRIPRRHIRSQVSLPAAVTARGQTARTTVVSLSDWGCRFTLFRELAEGEVVEIEIRIAKISMAMTGRVIYSIPHREPAGREQSDVGVMFDDIPAELRMFLRRNLILNYLTKIRDRLPREEFEEGIGFLNLSPRVLESLGFADPFPRGFLR